jgi:hypothetical protein
MEVLRKIINWLNNNRLILNLEKSQYHTMKRLFKFHHCTIRPAGVNDVILRMVSSGLLRRVALLTDSHRRENLKSYDVILIQLSQF